LSSLDDVGIDDLGPSVGPAGGAGLDPKPPPEPDQEPVFVAAAEGRDQQREAEGVGQDAGRQQQRGRDQNEHRVQHRLGREPRLAKILANAAESSQSLLLRQQRPQPAGDHNQQQRELPVRRFREEQQQCQLNQRYDNKQKQQAGQHEISFNGERVGRFTANPHHTRNAAIRSRTNASLTRSPRLARPGVAGIIARMSRLSPDFLTDQLALAEALLAGRDLMLEPQDLPGRYGCVVRAVDRVLAAIACEGAVGGGWAVWRHGYVGRITQDVDIVLPADRVEEFLRVASVSGFQVLKQAPGRWPKIHHPETDIQVDILPEGEKPGTPPDLAPTAIPHPSQLGAAGSELRYVGLAGLIELKIAAGRVKDRADVVELTRANPDQLDAIRRHLASVHGDYLAAFESLVTEAQKDDAR
jgi:hypothetical protein